VCDYDAARCGDGWADDANQTSERERGGGADSEGACERVNIPSTSFHAQQPQLPQREPRTAGAFERQARWQVQRNSPYAIAVAANRAEAVCARWRGEPK
jgi:hypothetical protein